MALTFKRVKDKLRIRIRGKRLRKSGGEDENMKRSLMGLSKKSINKVLHLRYLKLVKCLVVVKYIEWRMKKS